MTKEDSLDGKLQRLHISPDILKDATRLSGEDIEQIKQVFIDEGWLQVPRGRWSWFDEQMLKQIYPLMTGPEWCEKFEKELDWSGHKYVHLIREDVLAAAKRASGIKE